MTTLTVFGEPSLEPESQEFAGFELDYGNIWRAYKTLERELIEGPVLLASREEQVGLAEELARSWANLEAMGLPDDQWEFEAECLVSSIEFRFDGAIIEHETNQHILNNS